MGQEEEEEEEEVRSGRREDENEGRQKEPFTFLEAAEGELESEGGRERRGEMGKARVVGHE